MRKEQLSCGLLWVLNASIGQSQLMMSVELNMFSVQSLLQVKERLLKILTFWSDRKLYDKDTMQQLEAALLSGDPNAMLQAPAPKQVGMGWLHTVLLAHRRTSL